MNILTFLSTVMDFDEEGLASESLCESSLYATSPIIDEQLAVVHNDEGSLTTHIRCCSRFQFKFGRFQLRQLAMYFLPVFHLFLCLSSWLWGTLATSQPLQEDTVRDFFVRNGTAGSGSSHTNNWAVLVCASRYWFNYRVFINRQSNKISIADESIAYGQCSRDVSIGKPSANTSRRSYPLGIAQSNG